MNCNDSWISNRDYIREFNRKTAELRIPVSGSIDLTRHCNLSCVHCYMGPQHERQRPGEDEMPTERILSIIDEIAEAGCLFLLFTGGEPLLRSDFPEIYRHAKGKGLLITVFTNGTLISDRILDLFDDLPPYTVEISVYGSTACTYEKITGIQGSFGRCLSGINRLLERKIALRLKTILMTLNSHEFNDMENLAKQLGVKFRFDAALFPYSNGNRLPLSLRVAPEEVVEKEFSDMERAGLWRSYHKDVYGQDLPDRLYNCGAGRTGFHIDAGGRLKPCLMTSGYDYDLKGGDFLRGWTDTISLIRERRAGHSYRCNGCEKIHLCGCCPAFFMMENGSEDIMSEYLCSIGNHRLGAIKNNHLKGV
ncbi:MAG: radical SAM protein [Nitrospirae bacterium]|nr:radical SAM protein [Nitrospirota bacterium]